MKSLYGSDDVNMVEKEDIVRISRIISSDAFLRLLTKEPKRIEISMSVLKQMKRIKVMIEAIEIVKRYQPEIKIIKRG